MAILGWEPPSALGTSVGIFLLEGKLTVGDAIRRVERPDGESYPVSATILEMQAYGRLLRFIEPPWQVNLLLSGDIGQIGERWVLWSESPPGPP